jgi:hypothetical protein
VLRGFIERQTSSVHVRLDLRLQFGNLLLRSGYGINAGDEAAGRLLAGNRDQRSRELRRTRRIVVRVRNGVAG